MQPHLSADSQEEAFRPVVYAAGRKDEDEEEEEEDDDDWDDEDEDLDDEDLDELLRHADKAMYAAKQQGGGRYHFHSPAGHSPDVPAPLP